MRVYFVRHGETESNVREVMQPASDPLNEKGIEQAGVLAKRFSRIPIDLILSSPYPRALRTAEIINQVVQKELELNELIREKKLPTAYEGMPIENPEAKKIRALMREKNYTDPAWHHSDEENFLDLKMRGLAFLAHLDRMKEKNMLVVTHGTMMRVIIMSMMFGEALTFTEFQRFLTFTVLHNTSITLCEKNSDAPWKLHVWNDHMHLGLY